VAKQHYYTSHESINPRRFVPLGPTIDFEQPHGREHLEATS
jgi:putative glutathione S-transferase